MKRLVFDGNEEGAARFQFLYTGFLLGTPQGGLRGIEVMRRAATVLEKMETISRVARHPEDESQIIYLRETGDILRELIDEGGILEFEDQEFDMLKNHFEASPQSAGSAKGFVATADFLENAEEVVKK